MINKTEQELSEMDWIEILAYRVERDGITLGTSKTMPIGEIIVKGKVYQIQLRLEGSTEMWTQEGADFESLSKEIDLSKF
tara:strand:+ start:1569 stop:1808 length:240 start_codon:yes stop_codon:yes gene_type:complete